MNKCFQLSRAARGAKHNKRRGRIYPITSGRDWGGPFRCCSRFIWHKKGAFRKLGSDLFMAEYLNTVLYSVGW